MAKKRRTGLEEQLSFAIMSADARQFQELIDAGADVNTEDDHKRTLLHLAAQYGRREIIKILLAKGANIDLLDYSGSTPLHLAIQCRHECAVSLLLGKGANVNPVDYYGRTPMHLAVIGNQVKIVQLLLREGADVNLVDYSRFTPLHLAVQNNGGRMVHLLLVGGADINLEDFNRYTPLHLAVLMNEIDTAVLMIYHIAKLKAVDLYVSETNLQLKDEFISTSDERRNNYLQHFQNCKKEVERLKKESKPLYDFLKESNVDQLVSMWEEGEKNLKKQYPEYAYILINKINEVKKKTFLFNNKPLVDALPQLGYHGNNTSYKIKAFLEEKKDKFEVEFGRPKKSLIDFVDFGNAARHIPTLKLCAAVSEVIKNNAPGRSLDNPSVEQLQAVDHTVN